MKSQIKLGTVFGVKIGLHYSWLFIALLIVSSLTSEFQARHAQWGTSLVLTLSILTAICFFISLLLHELAHSLVAKSNGMPVREITLFALGGVSQIEKEPATAKIEFWMAFVGPLSSAVIGFVCLAAARLAGGGESNPASAVLSWLSYINFSLAVFNMVPGYPLDGGRVLRSVLWWKTGSVERATLMAARVGQSVGAVFIGLGILRFFAGYGLAGLWIAFIGWFLMMAAGESYLQSSLKGALSGIRVKDVMTQECPVVDGWLNIQNFVEQQLLRTGQRCFIVVENGQVTGLVTPQEVKSVERSKWPYKTLHEIMRPLDEIRALDPDTPLAAALESMSRYDVNQLPVLSHGHLEGVLSRAQVLNFLQNRAEFEPKYRCHIAPLGSHPERSGGYAFKYETGLADLKKWLLRLCYAC